MYIVLKTERDAVPWLQPVTFYRRKLVLIIETISVPNFLRGHFLILMTLNQYFINLDSDNQG
jgi:hypothetical protein